MTPNIPKDQLDRILPILDPLINDLRERTRQLSSQSDLALVYRPDEDSAQ